MWTRMRLEETRRYEYDDNEPDQVDIDQLVREILAAPPLSGEQLKDIESERRRRRHRRGEE